MDDSSVGSGEAEEVLLESGCEEPFQENELFERPTHHPSAPVHELFDLSTTVDPSYIISLIRKLLPVGNSNQSQGIQIHESPSGGQRYETGENKRDSPFIGGEVKSSAGDREAAWEENGCTLWDLAASETHAELMVQNLILEVILGNLGVSQSARTIEISLGIMGNLACHDVSRKQMALTDGLIETVVDKLFLDDAGCLCEAFRLLSLCLQGGEGVMWAEALSSEHVLSRILWVVENTLSMELIKKSVGFLTILGSRKDVATVLLPCLMKAGLPNLLVSLFFFAMSKLTEEGMPERYLVIDTILQAIEALSAVDEFSSSICSNKEYFELLIDLIKIPDKTEVANSCVTAAVLLANLLTDLEHLASELSQDMDFLQGILDIIPLASDDMEGKSALWSILARSLNCLKINELNPSSLHHYISIIARYSDMIEDELLSLEFEEANEDSQSFTSNNVEDPSTRSRILRGILYVLRQWKLLKDQARESAKLEETLVNYGDVDKLLDICYRFIKCGSASSII